MTGVRNYILATSGHVDHGKTALVRALTGTDTDRLPEERARGITIDLGFARLLVPAPPSALPTELFDIGIVDVPGHEDFVKNMVAGVGSVDAALLCIAADDGWMPQTEEHVQILTYLGVCRAVVALTKADIPGDQQAVADDMRTRLRDTPLAGAAVIPTSVTNGQGLAELRLALAEVLARGTPQPDVGKPRLPVDRAFTLKGVGTVVTGTLIGGRLRRGQEAVLQPGGITVRVRSLHSHGTEHDTAAPSARVAVNLPDVALAAATPGASASTAQRTVARGQIVTVAAVGPPARVIDVLLYRCLRAPGPPPRDGASVWLHHGSGAIPARLHLAGERELRGGNVVPARLALDTPASILIGDRVVLRDWSARRTLAGGPVLDVDPPIRLRDEAQARLLQARAAAARDDATAYVKSQIARDGIIPVQALLQRSTFAADDVAVALRQCVERGAIERHDDLVAEPAVWEQLASNVAGAVDSFHRDHPEQVGLPLVKLAALLHGRSRVALDAVVDQLCHRAFIRRNAALARASHRLALPPRLEPAGRRIRQSLIGRPMDPPVKKELAPDDLAGQALKFLIATGEVVQLSPDIVLAADAYQSAVTVARDFIRRNGPSTVAQLKTALGLTRRIAVPLLERLDRDGHTLRRGDLRVLSPHRT